MTTVDPGHDLHVSPPGVSYLGVKSGFLSWALTLDHKRIGLMYLVSVLSSFLFGGLAAMAVRTELARPGEQFLGQDAYNQMFTLHGAIMVFLVIIPSVPAALGNFVLPIMLGAKDVAFPRLNLMSYYLWIIGAICFVLAVVGVPGLGRGLDTGWTFYTPYSTDVNSAMGGVIMATTGAFILGFSSIFTGMNFLVTIHRLRPPGMTWFRMPLFLWSLYATAVIQVLATPVLGITLLLLVVERLLGIGIF
ncbi:MAG: cbb3-type cytochrome c oxidase subunit I, partial [Planctomycetota bacterium]